MIIKGRENAMSERNKPLRATKDKNWKSVIGFKVGVELVKQTGTKTLNAIVRNLDFSQNRMWFMWHHYRILTKRGLL